jgi:sugar lactone lactonase YvrE
MFNRSVVSVGRWALVVCGLAGLAVLGASFNLSRLAQAQDKKITVYLTSPPPGEGTGSVLRLDLSAGPVFPAPTVAPVVEGLTSPNNLICGPDKRLYVQDFVRVGDRFIGRIVRYDQDGKNPEVIVPADPAIWAWTMVFDEKGDLYVGAYGTEFAGIVRLKEANPANKLEQVIRAAAFRYGPSAMTFIKGGPLKGGLLIADKPERSDQRGGRVLLAKAPDFATAEPFIFDPGFIYPTGVAVNSQGQIFVTHFNRDGRVFRYPPDASKWDTVAAMSFANQLATDSTDTVWITNAVYFSGDRVEGGLRRLSPDGKTELVLDKKVFVRGVTACEE